MGTYSFKELFDRLNDLDEHNEIEAKRGHEIGKSILETISSFSNEPGLNGGFILLGVVKAKDPAIQKYVIEGIQDPDKIQTDLANKCKTDFNLPISPYIWCEKLEGKNVVGVKIDEAEPTQKEIYIKSLGPYKGAFRRIGSADHKLTDDDRKYLQDLRIGQRFEETPITRGELLDLDAEAIKEYRKLRTGILAEAEELSWSDEELLKSLYCTIERDGKIFPTVAGLILFGSEITLKRLHPSLKIDYVRVSGTEWVHDSESPFMYSKEFRGPLLPLIPKIIQTIVDDLPKGFSIPSGEILRKEDSLIPVRVIRESIVNAVTHRNYNTAMPIQIVRYSNRIEIKNPGHSLIEPKYLGQSGSKTRNEHISFVLHETGYAESKGSGIKVIRGEMRKANLSEPKFNSLRDTDEFIAVFSFHHLINPEDIQWITKFKHLGLHEDDIKALVFARKNSKLTNADYRDLSGIDINKASSHLRKLTDVGLLLRRGKGTSTYYVVNEEKIEKEVDYEKLSSDELRRGLFKIALETNTVFRIADQKKDDRLYNKLFQESRSIYREINKELIKEINSTDRQKIIDASKKLHTIKDTLEKDIGTLISDEVFQKIRQLGTRRDPEEFEDCIIRLCKIKPLTANQLARIFGVQPDYIKTRYIKKMVIEKRLGYTIPDKPKHPDQAYITINPKNKMWW